MLFNVYKKGSIKDWDYVTTLGEAKTNETGYFEFTYPVAEGQIINIASQFTDNNYNIVNTNIDKDSYNSDSSTVILFVNTNLKLWNMDSFFVSYQNKNSKIFVDRIYGNHIGYYKNFRTGNQNLKINAGMGHFGFPIKNDMSGFNRLCDVNIDVLPRADPYIDSVLIASLVSYTANL